MAATWNPALMQRLAEITAVETRAAGIHGLFRRSSTLDGNLCGPLLMKLSAKTVSRESFGAAFVAYRRRRHFIPQSCRHIAQALYWIQFSAQRQRSHFCLASRKTTCVIFQPTFAAASQGRRTHCNGKLRRDQRQFQATVNHHILTEHPLRELGFEASSFQTGRISKKLVSQWKVAADERGDRLAIHGGHRHEHGAKRYSFM